MDLNAVYDAVSHPIRWHLYVCICQAGQVNRSEDFLAYLAQQDEPIDIGKLHYHMNYLRAVGLVRRVQRGLYEPTPLGWLLYNQSHELAALAEECLLDCS